MIRGMEREADFTSALYLGMRHGSAQLPPWDSLTTGVPAALTTPPGAAVAARRLATLQGCEAATLLPSTLHLFWDLFGALAPEITEVWVDAGTYPIARWGAERAVGLGIAARTFPHHDPDALARALARGTGGRPLVVADGFCPACGRPAPLRRYLEAARRHGGMLVVDDTQALGIFGVPAAGAPYGSGGGGSLRRSGVEGPDLLLACSLAKGFGAPLAALSGARDRIRRFEERSRTRVHCSPPSGPALLAAARALELNRERGDALRAQLARRVRHLRRGLRAAGIRPIGGLFPVQTLRASGELDPALLHARLLERGIRTVLHRGRGGGGPLVSFIVNVTHRMDDLDRALAAVADVARPNANRSRRCTIHPFSGLPAPA